MRFRLADGCGPDDDTEGDLIENISQVVGDIQTLHALLRSATGEVTDEVSDRIDGPAEGHDQAHQLECGLHCWRCLTGIDTASLTQEDLKENVSPAKHSNDEGGHDTHVVGLTEVPADQHDQGAENEAPEDPRGHLGDG